MEIINKGQLQKALFTIDLEPVKETPKIDYEYQELGVRMQEFFGNSCAKQIWPLFWKVEYPLWKIDTAFKICEKKGIKDFKYLRGVLKNL